MNRPPTRRMNHRACGPQRQAEILQQKNAIVCPIPSQRQSHRSAINPRTHGCPRRPTAIIGKLPRQIPCCARAGGREARPECVSVLCVANADANTGASDTDPSISLSQPGWHNRKQRVGLAPASSSAFTRREVFPLLRSCARSSCSRPH